MRELEKEIEVFLEQIRQTFPFLPIKTRLYGEFLLLELWSIMNKTWSHWMPFPDPSNGGILIAPFGPGCYELRLGDEYILVGLSKNVAKRMTSLLSSENGGGGGRKNIEKRGYVAKHIHQIKYRTVCCESRAQARIVEMDRLKTQRYRFPT